jgi:hypothetical protein
MPDIYEKRLRKNRYALLEKKAEAWDGLAEGRWSRNLKMLHSLAKKEM